MNRRWSSRLLLAPTAAATESGLTSLVGRQDGCGRRRRPAAGATAGSAARTCRSSSKHRVKLPATYTNNNKKKDEFKKLTTKHLDQEKEKEAFKSQSVLRCSSSERKAVKKRKKRAEDVASINWIDDNK